MSSQGTVQEFSSLLPNATPSPNPLDETDDETLRYIYSPDPTVSESLDPPSLGYSLPLKNFSIRFAQIFFHASMENATRYVAGVSFNTSNYGDDSLNPDDGDFFQTHRDVPLVRTAADFSAAFAAGLKTVAVIGNN